eukprot:1461355-Rhodomonas_salina.1
MPTSTLRTPCMPFVRNATANVSITAQNGSNPAETREMEANLGHPEAKDAVADVVAEDASAGFDERRAGCVVELQTEDDLPRPPRQ